MFGRSLTHDLKTVLWGLSWMDLGHVLQGLRLQDLPSNLWD